ncbi:MAG: multifunctional oxoglutarate decarboxylase/oxoglutarate dehydrogenase thiamine pyrophosphate-binding subunit/dihydrolipoyllysine-residue succinyltransferase subunit [Planctomycetota bacterium]
MAIDFETEFGINAAYVEGLYESWRADPGRVDAAWSEIFQRIGPHAVPPSPAPPPAEEKRGDEDAELTLLRGIAAKVAERMTESLEVPTATSVRTVPAKLLDENRRVLNEHLQVRALGKASYTHLIAFAIVRALREMPRMQSAFAEVDGRPHRRVPSAVNLGVAVDAPDDSGERLLVVPTLRDAGPLSFPEFLSAYDDLVVRARGGELQLRDFQGTTSTLTNPGGLGTTLSVPRLMAGQGLIVGTGSIGVPPEAAGMSARARADLALGPVLTLTSTYDHRVIQGAESALFLRRVDGLLQGEDGFYDEIFRAVRVPWTPLRAASDEDEGRDPAELQSRVWEMINAYRVRGCRLADLDPLEYRPDPLPSLDPTSYGVTVWDLDRTFFCGSMAGKRELTLREILALLRRAYCRRWTVEYMHIPDQPPKRWIRERVEDPANEIAFDLGDRRRILDLLGRAENFERFLHTRYVGNKRFSLEGADTLIPALAELIEHAAERGVETVVVGMAHRGRLNVLAGILGKSYAEIFREFEGVLLPLSTEGSGDVKYHRGQRGLFRTRGGREVEVLLSPNPSHLEAVDPVVAGMTRARQDAVGDTERTRVLAVLIHGDAAFSGQGVVAETLNMSALRGYHNGGTVHLVVNNQIGFTASPEDLRSTFYCTDVAKSVGAPILHANGDYPESVLRAVRVAVDYQREFRGDAVVDMVCYRRRGHNEGDEPAYTQPLLYERIAAHPTVREHYTRLLIRRGELTREEAEELAARFDRELHEALESFRAMDAPELPEVEVLDLDDDDPADYADRPSASTGVPAERLVAIIDRANLVPEGFVVHPNLLRQLRRREAMARGDQGVDWGCAEALAFGSLLEDGVPVRLAGQDSARGTFSHRHAAIVDQATGAEHIPLRDLAQGEASFEAWDSLLSEEAALAFEYGYALIRSGSLVIWEAQFGDFVNGAQIGIDQFVLSGEAKWKQRSGVTLLLPHGYDGQGPEHSSARPERFLGLCSGGNARVTNCTTSAQYFHLLRDQGADPRRPLVVFTPKSLLRDRRAASAADELASGTFRHVLADERAEAGGVKRIVLCTGKVYYDLEDARAKDARDDVAIVRVEQLYPFPRTELLTLLDRSPDAEVVWCQEEPRNQGFWPFILQRFVDGGRAIAYGGRPEASSPATGSYHRHHAEQAHLVRRALGV